MAPVLNALEPFFLLKIIMKIPDLVDIFGRHDRLDDERRTFSDGRPYDEEDEERDKKLDALIDRLGKARS